MIKKMIPALFVLALSLGFAPSTSQAQQPAPAVVAGTSYSGTEGLSNNGLLMFEFSQNGKVMMSDVATPQRGKVSGSYTINGTEVTIRFKDCVYVGRINGRQITGTGQFTQGNNQQPWSFQMQILPGQPRVQ